MYFSIKMFARTYCHMAVSRNRESCFVVCIGWIFLLHIVHIIKENEVVVLNVFSLASLSPCTFPKRCFFAMLPHGWKVVLKFVFVGSFLLHIVHIMKENE